MSSSRWFACVGLALSSACATPVDEVQFEYGSMVDYGWVEAVAAHDPYPGHTPAAVKCDGDALRLLGDSVIDVTTGECNYLLLSTSSSVDVAEGQEVLIEFYHLDLYEPSAVGPQFGHMALSFDGELVWEKEIEIPSAARVYRERVSSPRHLRRGSEVVLHLHNHGTNEWRLTSIEALPTCKQLAGRAGACTR